MKINNYNPLLTKTQLVELDENFISILANSECDYPKQFINRYIVISKTNDCELDIESFNTITEVTDSIEESISDSSGWFIDSIWDLVKKKKMMVEKIYIKVELIYC